MDVFVDHSGYHLRNVGDSAMLQAALERLRHRWPGARFFVVSYAPETLRDLFPEAIPVFSPYHRVARALGFPSKLEYGPIQAHKILAPRLARRHRSRAAHRPTASGGAGLMEALAAADVVVATGGGYLNSTFSLHWHGVLEVLRHAQRAGKPTALLGQGIGPFTGRGLPEWGAATLRRADLISLRERVEGPRILARLGVESSRVVVTGDDAIEMAYALRAPRLGDALGLNVRSSAYAGATSEAAVLAEIGAALREAGERLDAPILPVPISFYDRDADEVAVRRAVGADRTVAVRFEGVPKPKDVIELVSRCRVVVTGSYHAAVFAASQGLPAVCLAGSPYYDVKFEGLAREFPTSCETIDVRGPGFGNALLEAVLRHWERAEAGRSDGLRDAERQIALGHRAYDALASIVAGRVVEGR